MEYIIYRISHKTLEGLDYVGSTTDFHARKIGHKTNCSNSNRRNYNLKIYQVIRANGGWDQFEMVIVKTMVCCKEEARQEEEKCRIELSSKLNSIRAVKSIEYILKYQSDYREKNKEHILNYMTEYTKQNREKIFQKFDCECGGKYVHKCKARHLRSNLHQDYLANLSKN